MPPQADFQPIVRRRLYQDVAESLERMILEGAFGEGDVLPPERELMARFAVGRPAIREALMSLQKNGLVVVSNGERARVSRPTAARVLRELGAAARVMLSDERGVRQFQAARRLLEMALAREAARSATKAQIAELRAALERNLAARGNPALFESTDVEFHYQIACIADNVLFIGLHEALTGWLMEQRTVSLRDAQGETHAAQFHRRIYNAIAAGDTDAAENAMRVHLLRVEDLYWKAVHMAPATPPRVTRRNTKSPTTTSSDTTP